MEVRRKSAATLGAYHPLSFVRVNAAVAPPAGFEAPNGEAADNYWENPANAAKAVPHRFLTYSDVRRYGVHLSGFEVNGIYIGRTDLEELDPERQEGRWPFDFGYLQDLRRFEIRGQGDDGVEIHLLSSGSGGINFVLGNVKLPVGAEAVWQHAREVGVEQVYIQRLENPDSVAGYAYRIRLVSHERILPVWEATLYSDDDCEL